MTRLGDYQTKKLSTGGGGGQSLGRITLVATILLLTLILVSYWFFDSEDQPVETTVVEAPLPSTVPAPPPTHIPDQTPPLKLPTLDVSDTIVRKLLAALSAHPNFSTWLVSDNMIRRFVVVVDNIANGDSPYQHLLFMRPVEKFKTNGNQNSLTVDPQSYGRYNDHSEIIASLDRQGTADLYRALEPLLDEAYQELGYPNRPFRQSLERAVRHLLATPIIESPPKIFEYQPFYRYQDEALESLTAAQKQFLMMGPDNVTVIQRVAGSISQAIGLQVH